MTVNDHQFSVRFVAGGVTAFATYLGLARLLAEPAIIGLGFVFFPSWFALSFFLLTRPPELDPALRRQPGPKLPFRWRLLGSCLAGMAISLLVMILVARAR